MIDSFHRPRAFGAIVAMWASLCAAAAAAQDSPLRVFAAASLTSALPEALESWEGEVILVFAGSSTLARQIELGAEADLFLSADPEWPDYLSERGLTSAAPVPVAGNALVVVAPLDARSPPNAATVPPFPAGAMLAVADVDAVPAGRYARRALEAAGDWPTKARLLETAHVREALAWAARGEVDFAIVYRSDATAEPSVTTVAEFPADPAHPIRFVGVAVAGGSPEAGALLRHLTGADAQAAFARRGFTPLSD